MQIAGRRSCSFWSPKGEHEAKMETVPVKLCAGSLSAKHGLKWANRDKCGTAREIYEENPGFPLVTLAKDARVQR
jgi:hypothetical protein